MNYEQKYKEAFKEAEKIHKFSSDIAEIKLMEQIFPELAENEVLIEDIKDTLSSEDFKHYNPEHTKKLEEALTWLEKQGEQKASYTTTVETGDGGINALVTIPFSVKKGEQKPVCSGEDNKWIKILIQTFKDGYFEGFNQLKSYGVIGWLKSLKQRIGG